MVEGPGFFCDMGNKAREIMSKGYDNGVNFKVAGRNLNDENDMVYAGVLTGNSFKIAMGAELKKINTNIGFQVDESAAMLGIFMVDKVIPGLKTIFTFNSTKQNFGEIEFRYQDKYAGISTNFDLSAKPVVSFSGLLSTELCEAYDSSFYDNHRLRFGAECAIDTATNDVTKLNIGLQTSSDYYKACVLKNLTVGYGSLTCCIDMSPHTTGCIELFRYLDGPLVNRYAFGIEHEFSRRTTFKARVDERGTTKVAIVRQWKPDSSMTISGELDIAQLNGTDDSTHHSQPGQLMRGFKFGLTWDFLLQ